MVTLSENIEISEDVFYRIEIDPPRLKIFFIEKILKNWEFSIEKKIDTQLTEALSSININGLKALRNMENKSIEGVVFEKKNCGGWRCHLYNINLFEFVYRKNP